MALGLVRHQRGRGHDPAAPLEYATSCVGRGAYVDGRDYFTLVFPGLAGFDFGYVYAPNHEMSYTLAEARLRMASAQFGGAPLWGNDTCLDRMEALISWAGANGADTSAIGLIGQSKGGAAVTNLAYLRLDPSQIKWMGLCVPSLSMQSIMGLDPLTEAQIHAVYGGADPPDDYDAIMHAEYYADIPTHIWASVTNDPVIDPAVIAEFAERSGAGVTWLGDAGHVDWAGIPAGEMLDFAREHS